MITEIDKNLWDFDCKEYYRVITTNGCIKKDGTAVMGKGIALQANQKYPLLSTKLANHIETYGNVVGIFPNYKIITFPTKNNWRNESNYKIIQKSCDELVLNWLADYKNIGKVVMPKVGCSNGGLDWFKVRNILYKNFENLLLDITIARI